MPQLPAEIILHVLECLIPPAAPVALSPRDPVTQTLMSFTLASRLTHQAAKRLLFKHCIYLDSDRRLDHVLSQLNAGDGERQPEPVGLFLAPFPYCNLEEPCVIKRVDQLLSHIGGNLRRLVIDIPLRSLHPDEDEQRLRKILRAAFVRLTRLEEFCSVRDELYLDTKETDDESEPPVWSFWPHLKRLALYNVSVEEPGFLQALRQCSNLTHLFLTRPDCLWEPIDPALKGITWWSSLQRIVIVNTAKDYELELQRCGPGWKTSFLGQITCFEDTDAAESNTPTLKAMPSLDYISVKVPPDLEDDMIDTCQEWVCQHAVAGTLWDISGASFTREHREVELPVDEHSS
ncbi:hypothetical protein BDV28DRAFT_110810 [Aspergillus coremiiformis]|uniref:F-box domain-containing protein n=1 Tax=Aspergillus coremiiformis TaxID=138285 RepID=A0A5N6ZG92_9EURO|nr:hypothetical protein BDV28DRAFT_110810 [Aspergillus coremiiformis]